MCFGHASSGRGLLGMLFLRTGVTLGETGLLISPGRPQDWHIQASSVQFDLEAIRKMPARLIDHHVAARYNEQTPVALEEEPTRIGQSALLLEGQYARRSK